ncbi:MAG: hypothetical protein MI741_10740, partial [Rhodospirillales bacterium]|nr:hypothetical protein [Rhodospirillales bacterium]
FAFAFRKITGAIDLSPFVPPVVCVLPAIAVGWGVRETLFGIPSWSDSPLVVFVAGGVAFGAVYISAYLVYRWRCWRQTRTTA